MVPVLRTPRLILQPLQIEDAAQTQQLFPHWEIVRYLSAIVPWPYPPDGALAWYRDFALPAVERGDAWHWTIRLQENPGQLIGAIGLVRGDADNRGFWLSPHWHGHGLMTEAVVATSDFWFDVLGFPVLRVSKAAANLASRRISLKTGMSLVGTQQKDYVSGRLTSEIWEITAEQWRAFRRSLPPAPPVAP
jgi:RimJ/RimL family protein N-acetyltransferase